MKVSHTSMWSHNPPPPPTVETVEKVECSHCHYKIPPSPDSHPGFWRCIQHWAAARECLWWTRHWLPCSTAWASPSSGSPVVTQTYLTMSHRTISHLAPLHGCHHHLLCNTYIPYKIAPHINNKSMYKAQNLVCRLLQAHTPAYTHRNPCWL